jgi:hypothetical protein
MQERDAVARDATALQTYILGTIAKQHRLDLLERVPFDVGGVPVPHHEPSSLLRAARLT